MSDDERRDELARVLHEAEMAWCGEMPAKDHRLHEALADAALAWFAATLADADDRLEAATNRMAAAERRLTRVDEVAAERDSLAAQLEAARQAAAEVQRHWQYGHQTYLGSGVAALIRTLAAPVEPQPEPLDHDWQVAPHPGPPSWFCATCGMAAYNPDESAEPCTAAPQPEPEPIEDAGSGGVR